MKVIPGNFCYRYKYCLYAEYNSQEQRKNHTQKAFRVNKQVKDEQHHRLFRLLSRQALKFFCGKATVTTKCCKRYHIIFFCERSNQYCRWCDSILYCASERCLVPTSRCGAIVCGHVRFTFICQPKYCVYLPYCYRILAIAVSEMSKCSNIVPLNESCYYVSLRVDRYM